VTRDLPRSPARTVDSIRQMLVASGAVGEQERSAIGPSRHFTALQNLVATGAWRTSSKPKQSSSILRPWPSAWAPRRRARCRRRPITWWPGRGGVQAHQGGRGGRHRAHRGRWEPWRGTTILRLARFATGPRHILRDRRTLQLGKRSRPERVGLPPAHHRANDRDG
jgi:hypothetical protein